VDATQVSLKAAIDSNDVPKIYANAFGIALTNADVVIVLQRFATNPVAVVNLSYTLAKTLSQRLGQAVAEFEKLIEQDILTTDRIDGAMKSQTNAKAKADEIH
jgi:hypothetical protein